MTAQIRPEIFPEPLRDLAAKVRAGRRLDEEDALLCLETPHLLHLGQLANAVRMQKHGETAFFNVNRHINPTNICVYTYNCKFCSFAALPGEDHAWADVHDEVYEHAATQGGNRGHRVPHRWRTPPRPVAGLVPRDATGFEGTFPRGASQGLHRDRDRMVRQAGEDLHRGGSWYACARPGWARCQEGAPRSSTRGARDHLRRQAGRRRVDGGPPHGSWTGHPQQLHHALRPRRKGRAQGGSLAATARPPGRHRWFQCLHPSGLSPREQLLGAAYHTTGIDDSAPYRHCATGLWTTFRTSRPTGS